MICWTAIPQIYKLSYLSVSLLDLLLSFKYLCNKVKSSVLLSLTAKEYEIGEVLSVGEKVEGIKEGDTIYFYSGAGKYFTHEGESYRVIVNSEVIVVL